ncbi:MAG TPA: GlsB/YeaQ/YmgE family stress response membrane protein [Polyangia bacterium]|jgi:uncharacterized membrane protein YeaQ/YmgE (transglycosylase-associated protein family)|nr:GlsB/YeaQ/YmgE family stress response membrane protein [Polyangia bacterium]
MTILWTLVVGLVAGALAKLAMPGKDPGGIVLTMAIGLAGSLLARLFGLATHLYTSTGHSIIASAIGAFVLLGLYRLYLSRRGIAHEGSGFTHRGTFGHR